MPVDTLTLPTFTIACEPGGRGYHFGESPVSKMVANSWGSGLNLILLRWASDRRSEDSFVLCLPIADGKQILMRAQYLGQDTSGPLAAINGVVLDQAALKAVDYRPERLLNALPAPNDISHDFAKQPWVGTVEPSAIIKPSDTLGLGWHDRVVINRGQASSEAVLQECLAQVPNAQRSRIQGFSSTPLSANGRTIPHFNTQLIISRSDTDYYKRDHKLATADDSGLHCEPWSKPEGVLAWEKVNALLRESNASDSALQNATWHPHYAKQSGVDVADDILQNLTPIYDIGAYVSLLVSAVGEGGDVGTAAKHVAKLYSNALNNHKTKDLMAHALHALTDEDFAQLAPHTIPAMHATARTKLLELVPENDPKRRLVDELLAMREPVAPPPPPPPIHQAALPPGASQVIRAQEMGVGIGDFSIRPAGFFGAKTTISGTRDLHGQVIKHAYPDAELVTSKPPVYKVPRESMGDHEKRLADSLDKLRAHPNGHPWFER